MQAIQNPAVAFQDPELKSCTVKTNPLGMPVVSSGGFALTFCLIQPDGQRWAVRCFHNPVPDRQQRYDAISRFLEGHHDPIFTKVRYISDGILVNGLRYPIIRMPWVEGQTLAKYIESNIRTNPAALKPLADRFKQLVETLDRMGIAHGDLQHGNIMISNGQLVLVDYDGMYVPELEGFGSCERGHPNYQHPTRQNELGPDLDRFSSIVIYLGLRAVTLKPELWQRYSNGDNLLFKQEDFRAPDTSPLLHELESIPDLGLLILAFRDLCKCDLQRMPRLTDFLAGHVPTPVSEAWMPAPYYAQYPIFSADDRDSLLANVGHRVTVIGQITDYRFGYTKYHAPYVFLNFGDWRTGCFSLVIWSEVLDLFKDQEKDPAEYVGKWVSVTGLLTSYTRSTRRKDGTRPQIIIEIPSEIQVLPGAETQAKQMLARASERPTDLRGIPDTISSRVPVPVIPPPHQRSPAKPKTIPEAISDLYKDWPAGPPPQKEKTEAAPRIPLSTAPVVTGTTTSSPAQQSNTTTTRRLKVRWGPIVIFGVLLTVFVIVWFNSLETSPDTRNTQPTRRADIRITATSNHNISTRPLAFVSATPARSTPQIVAKEIPSTGRGEQATPTVTPRFTEQPTSPRKDRLLPTRPTDTITRSKAMPPPCLIEGTFRGLTPNGETYSRVVSFEWEWDGILPSECGFEVLVWREGEDPKGIHNAVEDNRNGRIEQLGPTKFRLTVSDIRSAPGVAGRPGNYLWTVALVQIKPEYATTSIQAEPAHLSIVAE